MRALITRCLALLLPATVLAPAGATAGQAVAAAQAPQAPASAGQAAPAPGAPVEQGQAQKPNPLEPKGYTYEPEGRRDPFVSLVRGGGDTGSTAVAAGAKPPGLAGMATAELALTGTITGASGGWVAQFRGVDKKTYLAQAGDKLLDGTIASVSKGTVVIQQQVNDPLSLATQREVRKVLRETEEAK